VAAQRASRVLGAVHAPLLQERDDVVGEQIEGTRQRGRLQREAVAGSLGHPALDKLGDLLRCPGELQAARQPGELVGELPEGLPGLLAAAYDVVRAAGAVRGAAARTESRKRCPDGISGCAVNTRSAVLPARSTPGPDEPAWANAGRPCGDHGSVSAPLTSKNRPWKSTGRIRFLSAQTPCSWSFSTA
jgi:hypothetical protein